MSWEHVDKNTHKKMRCRTTQQKTVDKTLPWENVVKTLPLCWAREKCQNTQLTKIKKKYIGML